ACDRRPRRGGKTRRRAPAAVGAVRPARRPAHPARPASGRSASPRGFGRMSTGLPIAWLIARAAGLVAFGLLTLSVWLGLAMSSRLLPAKRTKTLLGLHRTLAWTGLSMLVLHVGALLFDPFLHFNVLSVLVPGAASWKPG